MTIREQIITLASTPDGVCNKEVADAFGLAYAAAGSHLCRLAGQLRLFRGQRAGQPLRWFADCDHRDAWVTAAPTGVNAQTVILRRKKAVPPPVTVDLHWRDPTGAVDYSRAVYTLDTTPRPTARWQMLPDEPPLGFGKLPLGATLAGVRA